MNNHMTTPIRETVTVTVDSKEYQVKFYYDKSCMDPYDIDEVYHNNKLINFNWDLESSITNQLDKMRNILLKEI